MRLALMETPQIEDAELVLATLGGDQRAFQILVERHQPRLFSLVRHYTRNPVEIEDLVQDTLLKAFARLASFQSQSSFYTWIYRIATNTILDWLKRQGRNPVQAVEDVEIAAPSAHRSVMRPDARLAQEEIACITQAILEELPEIFRTVLILREFEDLAYQEIADVLGISIGTVESRLFRARARFKERLLQKYPDFAQA